jgi:hypothetical protein
MSLKDFGKLTKLKITSENDGGYFTVMFNPESYSETFSSIFTTKKDINTGIEEYIYVKSLPQDFKLKLIIDGTGVSTFHGPYLPVFKNEDQTVYEQVNEFLRLAWYPVNGKATPLVIEWNKFTYYCMLKDVTINYTLFSREGLPLRAELDATFIGNAEKNEQSYKSRFKATGSLNSKTSIVDNQTGSLPGKTDTPKIQTGSSNNPADSATKQNGIIISVS